MSIVSQDTTFLGYRRENGRVGVRNHVIILPLDDLSNAAAEAVAFAIKGTLAIPHPYGRLQFGADLDLHFRTLIGTGCNPNVAAVVVIGIEDGWTKKVVDGIAATGKETGSNLAAMLSEYWQEEMPLIAKKRQVEAFNSDVDTLRADLARFEKKFAKLQQQLNEHAAAKGSQA